MWESGKVELSLEDPIEKRELKNFLKKRGHHATYTLNSELLQIEPLRLFELIFENIDGAAAEFNAVIRLHIENQEQIENLVVNARTLPDKFKALRRRIFSAETMRALLGGAVGLLLVL